MLLNHRRSRRENGVALLEVLVALVIVGLALSTCFGFLSDAIQRATRANAQLVAFQHAESILARVGVDLDPRSHELQGMIDERYSWRIDVLNNGSAVRRGEVSPINFTYCEFRVVITWLEHGTSHQAVLPGVRMIEAGGTS